MSLLYLVFKGLIDWFSCHGEYVACLLLCLEYITNHIVINFPHNLVMSLLRLVGFGPLGVIAGL